MFMHPILMVETALRRVVGAARRRRVVRRERVPVVWRMNVNGVYGGGEEAFAYPIWVVGASAEARMFMHPIWVVEYRRRRVGGGALRMFMHPDLGGRVRLAASRPPARRRGG